MAVNGERLVDCGSTPKQGAAAVVNREAIKNYRPRRLDRPDLAKAAVLIPVIPDTRGDGLIFTPRHHALRFQPGDISFPGGKAEPAESDLLLCALRETEEEIALPPSAVETLGELDQVTVAAHYLVSPFVGLVAPHALIKPGVDEVARVINVSVSDLLIPETLTTTTELRDGAMRSAYKFTVGPVVIRGATARILKRFLEIGYGACYGDSPADLSPSSWPSGSQSR
jgi:8-oxo-dGTP pyrophosphatase MutT (NUDIX family)